MTTALAIYGAVLSSVIAMFQIRNYILSMRFIDIEVHRYLGSQSELLEFTITNRSPEMTQVHGTMIEHYVWGGDVGFHSLWGAEVTPYRGHFEDPDTVKMPYHLKSGEALKCRYSSEDANHDLRTFGAMETGSERDINSELFAIEISHSRERAPKRLLFQMDRRYLKYPHLDVDWKQKLSFRQRITYKSRSMPYA